MNLIFKKSLLQWQYYSHYKKVKCFKRRLVWNRNVQFRLSLFVEVSEQIGHIGMRLVDDIVDVILIQ